MGRRGLEVGGIRRSCVYYTFCILYFVFFFFFSVSFVKRKKIN